MKEIIYPAPIENQAWNQEIKRLYTVILDGDIQKNDFFSGHFESGEPALKKTQQTFKMSEIQFGISENRFIQMINRQQNRLAGAGIFRNMRNGTVEKKHIARGERNHIPADPVVQLSGNHIQKFIAVA